MNMAFAFIAGLVWLGVYLDMADYGGVPDIALIGFFFFALFLIGPVFLLQAPDDAHLYRRAFQRLRKR